MVEICVVVVVLVSVKVMKMDGIWCDLIIVIGYVIEVE